MKSPIILALDTKDYQEASDWIVATKESVGIFKVGLELFLRIGIEGTKSLIEENEIEIFLDLKLHDIPNTVSAAATAVSSLQPDFLTVHAAGGASMISAAAGAL